MWPQFRGHLHNRSQLCIHGVASRVAYNLTAVHRRKFAGWKGNEHDARGARVQGGVDVAFDTQPQDLPRLARRLARRSGFGGDPLESDQAWASIAFQAEGVADDLSPRDAGALLCAFSSGRVLQRHIAARQSLVHVLTSRGHGALKPHRIVEIWIALDRADAADNREDFFKTELVRALHVALPPGSSESDSQASGSNTGAVLEGTDTYWDFVLALLAASGCDSADLCLVWERAAASALHDASSLRALSSSAIVSAMRASVLAMQRLGVEPAPELVEGLSERLLAHAAWLDGWATSHALLAAARLRFAPGLAYDALRRVLLERCALRPHTTTAAPSAEPGEMASFAQAERVAAAMALFDVHDAEVRGRMSGWLLRPLPAARFVGIALDLACIGLSRSSDARVARSVRARARSSELAQSVGADRAARLLDAYSQS